ncbi:hypothetical protein [Bradyrhizobium sp. BR 1432]|uniref:hypothetical protein n=1 Tax=Bradyrhizobium sp. BR 1432 TaxID=3447966 RepID=UPI003EE57E84
MKLLLDHQRTELLANSKANITLSESGLNEQDFNPVVRPVSKFVGLAWKLHFLRRLLTAPAGRA